MHFQTLLAGMGHVAMASEFIVTPYVVPTNAKKTSCLCLLLRSHP